MSEESCRKRLLDEGTCPICRDYFTNPVTLDCGHNFCSTCIDRVRKFSSRRPECPLCKEVVQRKKLRPNSQLANLVEVVQDLSNLLKHRGMCSVEEADQEFAKDQIRRALDILMKERREIMEYKVGREKASQEFLKDMEAEKEKTTAAFRQLHEFLEEQEKNLLAQTKAVEKEVKKRRDEHMAIISQELTSLNTLIQEAEEKLKQSSNELLQISGDILERCKKQSFERPGLCPVPLMWRMSDCYNIIPFLEGVMNQFKETLVSGLQIKEANVKLDPDTAHPSLILSEDLKSVRCEDKHQDLPNNPERFEVLPYVLGQKGFTSGRHFWEVAVSNEEEWSVGVAMKSVNRKGGEVEKILEMGMWNGEYRISSPSEDIPVNIRQELKKIRVTVDYVGRQVAFFNAETGVELAMMSSSVPFDGEVLLPCFNVSRKGHLTLCSQAKDN